MSQEKVLTQSMHTNLYLLYALCDNLFHVTFVSCTLSSPFVAKTHLFAAHYLYSFFLFLEKSIVKQSRKIFFFKKRIKDKGFFSFFFFFGSVPWIHFQISILFRYYNSPQILLLFSKVLNNGRRKKNQSILVSIYQNAFCLVCFKVECVAL